MPKTDAIVRCLLNWFAREARLLPWRRRRDPYAIWVSEVMLQQTQVKTVIPYWTRWMRMLPTLESLARARPQKVLKLWEGLGYYTRARNLQRAARVIIERHHSRFPEDFSDVLALPGIGPYTAGAICSIAFNQPTPILDGNVVRVLTRVFGIGENPGARAARERLWSLADDLVLRAARSEATDRRSCAELNQALMDLGATVCTPREPACPACPLRRLCVARREGRTEVLPRLDRTETLTPRHFVALVLEHGGRFLVRRRPAGVVNAQLWEFPNVEIRTQVDDHKKLAGQDSVEPKQGEGKEGRGLAESRRAADGASNPALAGNRFPPGGANHRALGKLAEGLLGFSGSDWELCVRIKHTITRYRMTVEAFRATLPRSARPARARGRWCSLADLKRLPFTSAHRRIARQLEGGRQRNSTPG